MRLHLAILLSLAAPACFSAGPALTIYNQQFAVVRETIPLNLKQGANQVEFTGTTAQLEPQSVMLRDPTGARVVRILEQNYRADPVSLEALLRRYEGQTIDFQVRNGDRIETVSGKIIRAGGATISPWYDRVAFTPYYGQPQPQPPVSQAIIEVAGKLRFDLPGVPLFPGLGADMILKPTLNWIIETDRAGPLDAELAYVSGGFNWNADYNIIQNQSNALDIIGWVTLANNSGKEFQNAHVKLMAGDVHKIQPPFSGPSAGMMMAGGVAGGVPGGPQVTEKTFDEYHLYTLERPLTIHDKESKQVEFVRASGVKSEVIYVYDGAKIDSNRYAGWQPEMIRQDPMYGTISNPKVWVMREFMNSDSNHLGMPLPKGRVRFYCRDTDARLEFTGEDSIDHTPKDEKIRVFTGAAFDLTGERKRTVFRIDMGRQMMDEAFEIKVRNHKKEPVEVRVVEHLYRWSTWEITVNSMPYNKTDAQTIEFRVPLQPDEEKKITYEAHYTW
ncbi:MAG TPA: DUF4139 domain-containing protein [Bryobacteraceae bacterium]|nr:DUF4139 domain-containing protein [Bryobacteraceae bacterium]